MIKDMWGMDVTAENDIADLGLSVRSYNALRRIGVRTVGDLAEIPLESLMSVRNLGIKSYHEIKDRMAEWREGAKREEETDWERRAALLQTENLRLQRKLDERGECHDVGHRIDESRFKCSVCGWDGWVRDASDGRDHKPSWCPVCGRHVREV